MTKDEQAVFDSLSQQHLPFGWSCEREFAYDHATHLVAPERSGGVVIKNRCVHVQLPGTGPASNRIEIADDVKGSGWLERITKLAVDAAFKYQYEFPPHKKNPRKGSR